MKVKLFFVVLVALLVSFNLFWNLSGQDIENWDEGHYIVSAVEMVHSGNFLVNTYMGVPDYWYAKPPLAFWPQALGYSLWHDPLLGLRLASPLSTAVLCVLMVLLIRPFAGLYPALLAVVMLVSMPMLMTNHGARLADPDCFFSLLLYAALLLMQQCSSRAFVGSFLLLGLAFLVKGLEVAPFGLVAFVYVLWCWHQGRVSKGLVLLLPLVFLLPVVPWVVARYHYDGLQFFHVMIVVDVLQRTTKSLEGVVSSPSLYVGMLGKAFWLPVLALLAALGFSRKPWMLFRNEHFLLVLAWFLVPFAIFTASTSRFYWYGYPLLPAFVLLIATLFWQALPDLPPRALALVGLLMICGLIYNQREVYGHVVNGDIGRSQATAAIRSIAAARAGEQVTVFLDVRRTLKHAIQPRDYATALLAGNVHVDAGGPEGFARSHGGSNYYVDLEGAVTRQQP
jgi:4-amino-4-deoxy-L-arabinose transferase